jgi:transposase
MENRRRFSMGAAIELRADYTADDLRRVAKASSDARQTRRLLALAAIYDGASRTAAARIGDVGLQIVRDWVERFNSEGPAGLVDRKAPGREPSLTTEQKTALARVVEAGPKPYLDGVVRWRLVDLVAWLHDEFGVSVSDRTVGRTLKRLGFRVLTARPQAHGQDPEAIAAFKKTSPRQWQRSDGAAPVASASRSGSRTRQGSARRT